MRVSRARAAENRQTVIEVASRLFRARGFDGIGLKALMTAAGLTQGAFYKQFTSKEDLAAEASGYALDGALRQWLAVIEADPADPLGSLLAVYLSPEHCAERMEGCPIVALGADAARQGGAVQARFDAGIRAHLQLLRGPLGAAEGAQTEGPAMASLSMMIGAMVLARLVEDDRLSRQFLTAAAQGVRRMSRADDPGDGHPQ